MKHSHCYITFTLFLILLSIRMSYGGQVKCDVASCQRQYGIGYCTDYIKHNKGINDIPGNAWEWYIKAPVKYQRGKVPQKNSIAVFSKESFPPYGHVAWVEELSGSRFRATHWNFGAINKNDAFAVCCGKTDKYGVTTEAWFENNDSRLCGFIYTEAKASKDFTSTIPVMIHGKQYGRGVPQLMGHVNDYAEMLSPQVRQDIEQRLSEFERSESTQIVVLTIPTLSGEVLEEFSMKVANSWQIGQKNINNGVMLLIAKQERKIRIEVGRGLEGKLTNHIAGQIIREIIAPRCKVGDYGGGITAGVLSIIGVVK